MSVKNPLQRVVSFANKMPSWLRQRILTYSFNSQVKLAGTAGLKILDAEIGQVRFLQKNRKKVQNHIGGIHAAAMALLAESATGFVVGVNLPGDKLPLLKSMKVNYLKRATGDMQAVATLTDEQRHLMQTSEKGEVLVNVVVTDEALVSPIEAEMIWAWVPKKRKLS